MSSRGTLALVLGAVAVFGADSALGADLRAPVDLENTMVLPARVSNPRFKMLYMNVDERLGGDGLVLPLGNRLNKPVKWSDIIAAQDDETAKNTLRGFLAAHKHGESDAAGSTTGVVNTYANVKVPVFAMGITGRLTAAVAVPVTHVEVNADTGFTRSAQGQAFINALAASDPVKAKEAELKMNDAVNRKLMRLGYKPITSMRVDHIGDVIMGGKYLAWKGSHDEIAVKGAVTLPTGKAPDADRALDVPTGDGQLDLGTALVWDHLFGRHFRTTVHGGYTMQVADRIDKRLPVSHEDSLSADKENVARKLGDIVTGGASASYLFDFGLQLSCGYAYQQKFEDQYNGGKYDPNRYRLLSFDTNQRMQAVMGGIGFNGVELYKKKKLPLPFQVNGLYSRPVEGVNVAKAELVTVEVAMFF